MPFAASDALGDMTPVTCWSRRFEVATMVTPPIAPGTGGHNIFGRVLATILSSKQMFGCGFK